MMRFLVFALLLVLAIADMESYTKRIGAKYLQEKATQPGVYKMKSGLLIEKIKNGSGKSPEKNSQCKVTYSGTLHDGTPFDSGTTSFAPNQVIGGWTEAMQYMVEGDKWKLHIPSELGYGSRGAGATIKPHSTLVFDIEIHEVKSGGKPSEEAQSMFAEGLESAPEL